MASKNENLYVFFLIVGELELSDVEFYDKKTGTTNNKPVLSATAFLLDNSEGRLSMWYNARQIYAFLKLLLRSLQPGQPFIIRFPRTLLKNTTSSFYVLNSGFSDYETKRNIAFMLKTSARNLKLYREHLPMIATLEEANHYGNTHGIGNFFQSNGSLSAPQAFEDLDFDPVQILYEMNEAAVPVDEEKDHVVEEHMTMPEAADIGQPEGLAGKKRKDFVKEEPKITAVLVDEVKDHVVEEHMTMPEAADIGKPEGLAGKKRKDFVKEEPKITKK